MKFKLVVILALLLLSSGKVLANNLDEFHKYSLGWGNSDYEIYSLLGKASKYQLTPYNSVYEEEGWKVFRISIEYPGITFELIKTPQKQFIQKVVLKGCGKGQRWSKITCNGIDELIAFLGSDYVHTGNKLVYTLPTDIADVPVTFEIQNEKIIGITWQRAKN